MEKEEKGRIESEEKTKKRRGAEDHVHAQEVTFNTYPRD